MRSAVNWKSLCFQLGKGELGLRSVVIVVQGCWKALIYAWKDVGVLAFNFRGFSDGMTG